MFIGGNVDLQDRDYYQERDKQTTPENIAHRAKSFRQGNMLGVRDGSAKNGLGRKRCLYPVFVLFWFWPLANADVLPGNIRDGQTINAQSFPEQGLFITQESAELIPGGIILQTDRSGHFRGTALLNNLPVPFMIDTGATQTAIPMRMAIDAGLPLGRSVQRSTAGGLVLDRLTQIKSLRLGNAEIKNLDASINQHLHEVLIGMNTLKYFHMTQSGGTLTLVANPKPEGSAGMKAGTAAVSPTQIAEKPNYERSLEPTAPDQPDKKNKTTWKKTVTCDGQNNCKTVYGDH